MDDVSSPIKFKALYLLPDEDTKMGKAPVCPQAAYILLVKDSWN